MPGRNSHSAIRRDPDRFREIALSATARRLAQEEADYREAVLQLRALADGRADLLAIAAGGLLGSYLARATVTDPRLVRAAALLVEAGADPSRTVRETDEIRCRVR